MYFLKKSLKYWLWGSICIIIINFIVFLFRDKVDQIVLLWVVILTPTAFLALYPLARFFDRDRPFDRDRTPRNENDF